MAWKKGPLPPNTWDWGGVVPVGENLGGGFLFADFKGNHAIVYGGGAGERRLESDQVAWYDNSLELPPRE